MEQYRIDIRHIEKLIAENAQRKDRLRRKNSRRLLLFTIVFLCIFFAFYQI